MLFELKLLRTSRSSVSLYEVAAHSFVIHGVSLYDVRINMLSKCGSKYPRQCGVSSDVICMHTAER